MRTLLKAEGYKLLRSRALYIILACLFLVTLTYLPANFYSQYPSFGKDAIYSPAEIGFLFIIWFPAFVGFFISSEFKSAIIRHSLSLGKSRFAVYLSKLIFAFVGIVVMMLFVIVVMSIEYGLSRGFGEISIFEYILSFAKVFSLELIYYAAFVSVFVMLAFLAWSQILMALFGIGFVMASTFAQIALINIFDGRLAFAIKFFPDHYLSLLRPSEGGTEFVQGIAISLVWIVASTAIGYIVFSRRDIK
jgi:ABC-type transport system involved in multi-copper enzyme maturation permease subunit